MKYFLKSIIIIEFLSFCNFKFILKLKISIFKYVIFFNISLIFKFYDIYCL